MVCHPAVYPRCVVCYPATYPRIYGLSSRGLSTVCGLSSRDLSTVYGLSSRGLSAGPILLLQLLSHFLNNRSIIFLAENCRASNKHIRASLSYHADIIDLDATIYGDTNVPTTGVN
jgi:hypothetical protein